MEMQVDDALCVHETAGVDMLLTMNESTADCMALSVQCNAKDVVIVAGESHWTCCTCCGILGYDVSLNEHLFIQHQLGDRVLSSSVLPSGSYGIETSNQTPDQKDSKDLSFVLESLRHIVCSIRANSVKSASFMLEELLSSFDRNSNQGEELLCVDGNSSKTKLANPRADSNEKDTDLASGGDEYVRISVNDSGTQTNDSRDTMSVGSPKKEEDFEMASLVKVQMDSEKQNIETVEEEVPKSKITAVTSSNDLITHKEDNSCIGKTVASQSRCRQRKDPSTKKEKICTSSSHSQPKCVLCKMAYKTFPRNFKQHMKMHFQETCECTICSVELPELEDFVSHVRKHQFDATVQEITPHNHSTDQVDDTKKTVMCVLCKKKHQVTSKCPDKHISHHYRKSSVCPICITDFPLKSSYVRHIREHQSTFDSSLQTLTSQTDELSKPSEEVDTAIKSKSVPNTSMCVLCKKACKSDLRQHFKAHFQKSNACAVCTEHLPNSQDFVLHVLEHQRQFDNRIENEHNQSESTFPQGSQSGPSQTSSLFRDVQNSADINEDSNQNTSRRRGGPFVCETCGKSFRRRTSLVKHSRVHEGEEGAFSCDRCSYTFRYEVTWRRHIAKHDNASEQLPCEYCGRVFFGQLGLKVHIAEKHNTDLKETIYKYKCDQCSAQYKCVTELRFHKNYVHQGVHPLQCKYCGRGFNCYPTLRRHIRNEHTKDFQLKCKHCPASFGERWKLVYHEMSHTGMSPYQCDICNRYFSTKFYMKKHRMSHDIDRPRPFKCEICDVAYFRNFDLQRHLKKENCRPPSKKLT